MTTEQRSQRGEMKASKGVRRNIANSLAIILEQGVKIAFGMYVGFYLVRHLGPDGYGELSLGMSIAALTGSIARLGLDGVALRTMAENPARKLAVQAASFQILLLAALVNLAVLFAIEKIWLDRSVQSFLLPILGAGLVFQTVSVMDWGQQLDRKSGVSAAVRTASAVLANIGKLLVIILDGGVILVAVVTSLENLFGWLIYQRIASSQMRQVLSHRPITSLWGRLARGGVPMVVTLFATSGYSRIDHLLISSLYDNSLLGAYAAAIKIFDSWVVLPYMLTTQFIPALVASRAKGDYVEKIGKLYLGIMVLSLLFCIPMMLMPSPVISILYGDGYEKTAWILPLIMYSAVMASVVSCNTRVLITEGLERIVAIRALISLLLMVTLCYPLTLAFSIVGAAFALGVTLTISAFMLDYLPLPGGALLREAKVTAVRLPLRWRLP